MENYIISCSTLAIIGITNNSCKIIEENDEFLIKESWQQVLSNSCLYYGSSLQGRIEGSRYILNRDYKVPIIVNEKNGIILFPIGNQTEDSCIWISLKNLENYKLKDGKVEFNFSSKYKMFISVSEKICESQLLKAYNLERIYNSRC